MDRWRTIAKREDVESAEMREKKVQLKKRERKREAMRVGSG